MKDRRLEKTFRRILVLSMPMLSCASPASDGKAMTGAQIGADGAVTSCGEHIVLTGPYGTQRCYAQCFPLEAGAFGGDAAASDGLTGRSALCQTLCGDGPRWFSCEPTVVAGAPMIRCQPDCTGRRPAGLMPSAPSAGPALGAYFAEMARLEAASVDAFRQLRAELFAHRAPRLLVRATERAARDEVRHARTTRALARRYGGTWQAPIVEQQPLRDLEAIAVDNAVEGCVRETFGALMATRQARTAGDPVIRAAMSRIARDETRHAALAHSIHHWTSSRLDAAARSRVAKARRQATDVLIARAEQHEAPVRSALGLPTREEARSLAVRLAAALT
jgi:hypothetical protein